MIIDNEIKHLKHLTNLLSSSPVVILNKKLQQEINKRVEVEKKLAETCRMLRNMCDNLQEMIWCKDLNEKYMFANKAVCENLLFTTIEEVVGKDDIFFALREQALAPSNDKFHTFGVKCHESDRKVLTSGKAIHLDEEGYLKGKKVILEITKSPFFDEAGKLIGIVGSGKFVTEQRITEKRLIESEAKYKVIVESSQDAIFLMDGNKFIDCNKQAVKMFGCMKRELIDSYSSKFSPKFQPDGKSSGEEAMIKISAAINGIPQRFYWRHIRCDGLPFDTEVSLNKIEINGGSYHIAVVRLIEE